MVESEIIIQKKPVNTLVSKIFDKGKEKSKNIKHEIAKKVMYKRLNDDLLSRKNSFLISLKIILSP